MWQIELNVQLEKRHTFIYTYEAHSIIHISILREKDKASLLHSPLLPHLHELFHGPLKSLLVSIFSTAE